MQYKHILEMVSVCAALANDYTDILVCAVSVRLGDDFLITDPSKKLNEIKEEDIIKVTKDRAADFALYHALYAARKDVNAIITYTSPYINTAAEVLDNLPAVLADMVIIGAAARTAKDNSPKSVLKAIGRRNGCLVRGHGAIATGKTLCESSDAALALKKNARSYIEANVLGGAVKIGTLDAMLMRLNYKRRYCKISQAAKAEAKL